MSAWDDADRTYATALRGARMAVKALRANGDALLRAKAQPEMCKHISDALPVAEKLVALLQ